MSTLMIQGTTSNAGKSAVVTGLCRFLKQKGYSVAPFKPQNMSLNSAVTIDGGEIGRAQYVQAEACEIDALIDMNPILLKPSNDIGAQVIVHGKPIANMDAHQYHQFKPQLLPKIIESYERLSKKYDIVIVEGAGSPAEINLRAGDLANMGFAEYIKCPVLLVADIDRGGVFAQLYGTHELLSASEQKLMKGFIINKFRGDISLLKPGIDWLENQLGKPVLGVLPYLENLHLEAEDSLVEKKQFDSVTKNQKINVVVPVTPKLSNRTDFDSLALHPQVNLHFIEGGETLPSADLIVLGGSKSVRADLAFIKQQKWDEAILKHLRYGGKLIGLCGGFQMLGKFIHDPLGIESEAGSSKGLNLLEMETIIDREKKLAKIYGQLWLSSACVEGYEIHMGISKGPALTRPAINLDGRVDGAVSEDKQIFGTYMHGLFDHQDAFQALLHWVGLKETEKTAYSVLRKAEIDRLAVAIEAYLNLDFVYATLGINSKTKLSTAIR